MNDYASLFSPHFFTSTWKAAETTLRVRYPQWSTVMYYTAVNLCADLCYWTVRVLPLRDNAFKAASDEIKMATTRRKEVCCVVCHWDDPGLIALLGVSSASWLYALAYMLDNVLVFCRVVYAYDTLHRSNGASSMIYLLSNPIAEPTIATLYAEYVHRLTPIVVLRVATTTTHTTDIDKFQADWRCETPTVKLPFVVAGRFDTTADVDYWFGPSYSAEEQMHALGGPEAVASSTADGLSTSPNHFAIIGVTTDVRFRWPFHFERMLALCLSGGYILPVAIARRLLVRGAFVQLYESRFDKTWHDMVASIRRICDSRHMTTTAKRNKVSSIF